MDKVAMYREHIEKEAGFKQIRRILKAEKKSPRLLQGTDPNEIDKTLEAIKRSNVKSYFATPRTGGELQHKGFEGIFSDANHKEQRRTFADLINKMDKNGLNTDADYYDKVNKKYKRRILERVDKRISELRNDINGDPIDNYKRSRNLENKVWYSGKNITKSMADKSSDVADSHFHNKEIHQFPKTYERDSDRGVYTSNVKKNSPYYKGVKGLGRLENGDAVWVSSHPDVAKEYGNTVIELKSNKKLLEGASLSSTAHTQRDSRQWTRKQINEQKGYKSHDASNLSDYERVLSFNKKSFPNSITNVYTATAPRLHKQTEWRKLGESTKNKIKSKLSDGGGNING